MVDPQASRFWQAALQSGLIDEAGLDACWDAIPAREADARRHRPPPGPPGGHSRACSRSGRPSSSSPGRSTGFKIDRYLLLDLIGQGGMGRVYLARDTRLNRRVALKILSPERMNNPRAIARFQREAQGRRPAPAREPRPDLRRGRGQRHRYLVMEYIEGKNVGQLIAEHGPIRLADRRPAGPAGRAGAGARPAEGADPPRRQPVQHPGHPRRHGQADRPRPGDRPGRRRTTSPATAPPSARSTTSRPSRPGTRTIGRHPERHLLAGLHALPHDRRPGAVPVPSLPEKLYAHQLHDPEPLTELVAGRARGAGRGRPQDDAEAPRGPLPDPAGGRPGAGALRDRRSRPTIACGPTLDDERRPPARRSPS